MGLSGVLARSAARRAHVLPVEVPGEWRTRVAVERTVLTRGWSLALSPADADVLAVCGVPGPRMSEVLDLVWNEMPGPRVRVDIGAYDDAAARADEAYTGLLATERHRSDARSRLSPADLLSDHHGDMDHGDMDHGDMDHGDMDMSPHGIPLAEGGQDRDGLGMDVLNVRLGPVLPHWPAGLVVRCSLQGDVVTAARGELLEAETTAHGTAPGLGPARGCDNLAALLALAGWGDAATEARSIRDAILGGRRDATTGARFDRLHRRVRGSRVLRWSLRGIRSLGEVDLEDHGLPGRLRGDTYDRLLDMLDRTEEELGGRGEALPRTSPTAAQVAHLVVGMDLATARLVIASLDIHALRSPTTEELRRA